jgi:glycosyltransferase involved in cell wall biosynthesis
MTTIKQPTHPSILGLSRAVLLLALIGQCLFAMQPYSERTTGQASQTGELLPPGRLRIMVVSVHPPYGGGSAHSSKELALGLRRLGHDVLQVAPYNHDREESLAQEEGLHWIKADFPWNELSISAEAQASMDADLQAVYRKYGPFDYVILGRETFVWHMHAIREVHAGPVMLIVRGAYINRLAGNTNETIDPQLKEQLVGLYREADVIVCIARHLVKSINKVIFDDDLERARTAFIPNPIELPAYDASSQMRGQPGQTIRLAMAPQIKGRKKPLDAVEIVRELRDRGADVELTVYGDGPDMSRMRALIERYGLEKQVVLRGHVTRAEVLEGFSRAETVLLCSDNEGWPRVLQEAIAAGKGVVAYDNIGSREVLKEWITPWALGRLVPIGDFKGAADAVADLAHVLRSSNEPIPPPDLPNSLAVLREYEYTLRHLDSHL